MWPRGSRGGGRRENAPGAEQSARGRLGQERDHGLPKAEGGKRAACEELRHHADQLGVVRYILDYVDEAAVLVAGDAVGAVSASLQFKLLARSNGIQADSFVHITVHRIHVLLLKFHGGNLRW